MPSRHAARPVLMRFLAMGVQCLTPCVQRFFTYVLARETDLKTAGCAMPLWSAGAVLPLVPRPAMRGRLLRAWRAHTMRQYDGRTPRRLRRSHQRQPVPPANYACS